jgi:hypothetical protein
MAASSTVPAPGRKTLTPKGRSACPDLGDVGDQPAAVDHPSGEETQLPAAETAAARAGVDGPPAIGATTIGRLNADSMDIRPFWRTVPGPVVVAAGRGKPQHTSESP